MKFGIWVFFENLVEKIKFLLNSGKNICYFVWKSTYILYEHQHTFCMNTNIHFVWTPTYILYEHQHIFCMNTNIHFVWTPTYILYEHQHTFCMNTNIHFAWTPIYILYEHQHTFCMNTNIHFWSYQTQFVLEWEIFRKKLFKKIKNFMFSIIFFLKIVSFMRESKSYFRTRYPRNDNYGACALNAGYLRLQTHIQNI